MSEPSVNARRLAAKVRECATVALAAAVIDEAVRQMRELSEGIRGTPQFPRLSPLHRAECERQLAWLDGWLPAPARKVARRDPDPLPRAGEREEVEASAVRVGFFCFIACVAVVVLLVGAAVVKVLTWLL